MPFFQKQGQMSASEFIHVILSSLHLHYTVTLSSNLLWELILNIGEYHYEVGEQLLNLVQRKWINSIFIKRPNERNMRVEGMGILGSHLGAYSFFFSVPSQRLGDILISKISQDADSSEVPSKAHLGPGNSFVKWD